MAPALRHTRSSFCGLSASPAVIYSCFKISSRFTAACVVLVITTPHLETTELFPDKVYNGWATRTGGWTAHSSTPPPPSPLPPLRPLVVVFRVASGGLGFRLEPRSQRGVVCFFCLFVCLFFGGSQTIPSTALSLLKRFCIEVGSVVSHFNVSLIGSRGEGEGLQIESHDCVHKRQRAVSPVCPFCHLLTSC